jgi:hypothetical protein
MLPSTTQGFAPATLDEALKFSEVLARSSMVPTAYKGKAEDILVAVIWGKELGLAPLQALQNIATINGKPSVYGDAALALVQASPVCDGIEESIEGEGTANPVAVCIARRKGRSPVTARFSVEDAKRAGLWGKGGPWSSYPKRMLQMRARGFALRDAFPDVLKGLITAEEAADFPAERDVTPAPARPANPLDALAAPKPAAPPEPPEPEVIEVLAPEPDPAPIADAATPPVEAYEEEDSEEGEGTVHWPAPPAIRANRWELLIPGKDAAQVFDTMEAWSTAYEELAGKVARARLTPEQRRTKLMALRELNLDTLERLPPGERVKHVAASRPVAA